MDEIADDRWAEVEALLQIGIRRGSGKHFQRRQDHVTQVIEVVRLTEIAGHVGG